MSDKECYFRDFNKYVFEKKENRKEKLISHYKEIYCGLLYLNNFVNDLKTDEQYENINIFIISDAGLKIDHLDLKNKNYGLKKRKNTFLKDSYHVLFAVKNKNSKFVLNKEKISSQELFSKYFNDKYIEKKVDKKVYDLYEKEFLDF